MPRPKTKAELLEQAEINYVKLQELIDTFTPEQQEKGEFPFEDRDRNIRDVLIHLEEWLQMLLKWEKANMKDEEHEFLRAGYNWKTYPQMNVEIWEEHQQTSLAKAKEMLAKSHKQAMEMIESHSDEELFAKKYYSWTGNSSLGAYCISATSSHYDWAIKKIKRYQKTLAELLG